MTAIDQSRNFPPPKGGKNPEGESSEQLHEGEAVWLKIRHLLEREVPPASFLMWFNHCQFVDSFENRLVLTVPSEFIRDWIQLKYLPRMRQLFAQVTNLPASQCQIFIEVQPVLPGLFGKEVGRIDSGSPSPTINRESITPDRPGAPATGAHSRDIASDIPLPAPEELHRARCRELNIQPDLTFDNFIEGSGNNIALAFCKAVAAGGTGGSREYNPLFIHGDVGLGKTHLLHAIANDSIKRHAHAVVRNVSMERLISDWFEAINKKSLPRYRLEYSQCHLLLVDDIQFLKEAHKGVQQEFFHIFNDLIKLGNQIVIAADRPLAELNNIEHRLVSRFDSGQRVGLLAPDYNHRLAILRHAARERGIRLSDPLLEYLAEERVSNIRALLANLIRIYGYSQVENIPLSRELIDRVVREQGGRERYRVDIRRIMNVVADHFEIEINELKGAKRKKSLTRPRHIAMYLCRQLTDEPLTAIGQHFGGKDHSSVIYSIDKIANEIQEDLDVRESVETLKRKIEIDVPGANSREKD